MPTTIQRALLHVYSARSKVNGALVVSLEIFPDGEQSVQVTVELAPSEARELADQLVAAADRSEDNRPNATVIPLLKRTEQKL